MGEQLNFNPDPEENEPEFTPEPEVIIQPRTSPLYDFELQLETFEDDGGLTMPIVFHEEDDDDEDDNSH